MIDVKSLMIGNWVIYENKYIQVESIDGITINQEFFGGQICFDIKMDELSPIPLTPEILLKCGFVENGMNYTLPFGALKLNMRFNGKVYTEIENSLYLGDKIEFLHQLQNFYYITLGKELEVKL